MSTRIPARRAASIRQLCSIKDVTPADARQIRAAWHHQPNRQVAREQVDQLLRTFGVEHLGLDRRTGQHVYYANAGDTYAGTVLFRGPVLFVGCWGDLVEANRIKEAE